MSQFVIEILDVSPPKTESKNGRSWNLIEVAYKRLPEGKVEGRKVVSFNKEVYDVFAKAKRADVFTIETVKNDKSGYWDWVKATMGDTAPKLEVAQRSSWQPRPSEDPTKRQSSIERQNALTNAVAFASISKKNPSVSEVLEVAEVFYGWTHNEQLPKTDPVQELMDMANDMPA